MNDTIAMEVRDLGLIPYAEALALQSDLVGRRRTGDIPDQLLLLQHPHVITLGTAASRSHVLADESRRRELGIDLVDVGRGGDVTYHGPGQLVGYPILDLKPDRKDVHQYLRDLEAVLVHTLDEMGIRGEPLPNLTGRMGGWSKDRSDRCANIEWLDHVSRVRVECVERSFLFRDHRSLWHPGCVGNVGFPGAGAAVCRP